MKSELQLLWADCPEAPDPLPYHACLAEAAWEAGDLTAKWLLAQPVLVRIL